MAIHHRGSGPQGASSVLPEPSLAGKASGEMELWEKAETLDRSDPGMGRVVEGAIVSGTGTPGDDLSGEAGI